jgi:SAM-dependent methyltransferase
MKIPKLKADATMLKIARRFIDIETWPRGSRYFEYGFTITRILLSGFKGRVLDIGCAALSNYLPLSLSLLGYEVYGIDLLDFMLLRHPNFHFSRQDIRKTTFQDNFFDYVYAISSIEHVGLTGRYSVTEEDPEGDLKAVQEVIRIISPNGKFLMTLLYGKGEVVKPKHRIYGSARLRELTKNWKVTEEVYFKRNEEGYWIPVPEEVAGKAKSPEWAVVCLELSPIK